MIKLPKYWGCFLPVWLFFPAFLGIIVLAGQNNIGIVFLLSCIYMLLTMLSYIPLRYNKMSLPQALLWVTIGTMVLGIPGIVLIYVFWGK